MENLKSVFLDWLLLEGDRYAVAATLSLGVFLFLYGSGYVGLITVTEPAAVRGAAGGMIPGLFTFLSIVLAINQLVLSQEYGSADEVRTRIEDIRAFRQDLEASADTAPSPVNPTDFLSLVVRTIETKTETLADSARSVADADARESIGDVAESLGAEADQSNDALEARDQGRVNALLPVLEFPYSHYLYEVRELQEDYGDDLPTETQQVLADLIDVLEFFSVARTHFRTTYTQRVLAQLSRILLYVGIPGLLAAITLNMLPTTSELVLLERYRLLLVSVLFTVAFSPLAVLFAYLLRIATVSERTISVGPFVSRPDEGE